MAGLSYSSARLRQRSLLRLPALGSPSALRAGPSRNLGKLKEWVDDVSLNRKLGMPIRRLLDSHSAKLYGSFKFLIRTVPMAIENGVAMSFKPWMRSASRLAAVIVVLLGLLFVGGRAARADDNEPPVNVSAVSNSPGVVTVYWTHSGDGVFEFDIEEKTTGGVTKVACPCDYGTSPKSIGGLQQNNKYEFRVCAAYDAADTDRACSDANNVGYYPVLTMGQGPTGAKPLPPVIINSNPGGTSMGLTWETNGDSYDKYIINYQVEAAAGAPPNPGGTLEVYKSGSSGSSTVSNLLPGTTYLFSVQACFVLLVIGGYSCSESGPAYKAATLAGSNAGPTPVITSVSGDTTIDIYWTTTPDRYPYNNYNIRYRVKPAPEQTPPPFTTDVEAGTSSSHSVFNLTPGTTYVFAVQGCPGQNVDCSAWSPDLEISTKFPTPSTSFNLPPTLSLSVPTVAAGNTVKVTGQSFANSGAAVTLTLTSQGVPIITLGTATVSQGGFSTTVTVAANTGPSSYQVHAQSTGAQADASLQVTAPSSKQTLIVTDSNEAVATSISSDSPYTLIGNNFAPGFGVTLYLDSKTGPQLGTATAGLQNETFTMTFNVTADQIGHHNGSHSLVVVSDGLVVAQVTLPFAVLQGAH
jgi:Fibronectin type III domain